MAGGIFVSYRRNDAKHAAGRLFDRLSGTFSNDKLFLDVEQIEPGLDFRQVISEKVGACEVLIAVIGPQWLESRSENGERRLDNPEDLVRFEIETALKRGVRIIPVLLDGAKMPGESELPEALQPLSTRNAVRVMHERFAADADGLIKHLKRIVGSPVNSRRDQKVDKVGASGAKPPLPAWPAAQSWNHRPPPALNKAPKRVPVKEEKIFPWLLMTLVICTALAALFLVFKLAAQMQVLLYVVLAPLVVSGVRLILRDHRMPHRPWEHGLNYVAALSVFVMVAGIVAVAFDWNVFGQSSAFTGMFIGAALALVATVAMWFLTTFIDH